MVKPLTLTCLCNGKVTPIWSGAVPHYREQINCPQCGHDYSVSPPLMWRLRYGKFQFKKRRVILGLWQTLRTLRTAFLLERERNNANESNSVKAI